MKALGLICNGYAELSLDIRDAVEPALIEWGNVEPRDVHANDSCVPEADRHVERRARVALA